MSALLLDLTRLRMMILLSSPWKLWGGERTGTKVLPGLREYAVKERGKQQLLHIRVFRLGGRCASALAADGNLTPAASS